MRRILLLRYHSIQNCTARNLAKIAYHTTKRKQSHTKRTLVRLYCYSLHDIGQRRVHRSTKYGSQVAKFITQAEWRNSIAARKTPPLLMLMLIEGRAFPILTLIACKKISTKYTVSFPLQHAWCLCK